VEESAVEGPNHWESAADLHLLQPVEPASGWWGVDHEVYTGIEVDRLRVRLEKVVDREQKELLTAILKDLTTRGRMRPVAWPQCLDDHRATLRRSQAGIGRRVLGG
jgi:hypothetical protein